MALFNIRETRRGQALVEFALVSPILLLIMLGTLEFGRLLFAFSEVSNASRNGARFGIATGRTAGTPQYLDCNGIRDAAREATFLTALPDSSIQIAYDRDNLAGGMSSYATCGQPGLEPKSILQGDRIVVTIERTLSPVVNFLPIPDFNLRSQSARTVLKGVIVGAPQCSDGVDNDGDGATDYPADLQCDNAQDVLETTCHSLDVAVIPLDSGEVVRTPLEDCFPDYTVGTAIDFQANAADGYVFDYWAGSVGGTNPQTSLTMDSAKLVEAHFRLVCHLVSFETNPTGAGNILRSGESCEGGYLPGSVITMTAVATNFFNFVSWTGDATGVFPVTTLLVDTPKRVVANFSAEPGTVDVAVVSKSSEPNPVLVGEPFTYTIEIANYGPGTANSVEVQDQLPAGVTYLSAFASQGTCTELANYVICDIGKLDRDQVAAVQIHVFAPAFEGLISNEATVTNGTENDPLESNNSSGNHLTSVILNEADLVVLKSASPNPALFGEQITYSIQVINNGPATALGVSLVDTLPAGLTLDSYSTSQGSCSVTGLTLLCDIGQLDIGSGVNVTLVATAGAAGDFTNSVVVSSSSDDPSPTSASVTSSVVASADLSIAKSASSAVIQSGDSMTYYLTAHNSGPSDAELVEVIDDLPSGVMATAMSTTHGICSSAGGFVQCALGTLLSGGTAHIELTVSTLAQRNAVLLVNGATIGSDTADPDLSNNETQNSVTALATPNLVAGTLALGSPASTTEPITYTFVIRNESSTAVSNFRVSLYYNPTGITATSTHINSLYKVAEVTVASLAGNSSTTVVIAGPPFSTAATHTVYAVVDSEPFPAGVIDETSETDNLSIGVAVKP